MGEYDFRAMSDRNLLVMLAELEEEEAEGNEDFCRAVRQELIRRWMGKEAGDDL